MKKILCCLLLVLVSFPCYAWIKNLTPRAEGEKRVGDIVVVAGEMGVVFAVTSDGRHGKVMSVADTKNNWGNAKKWCSQYGNGWRLPTKDELRIMYRNKRTINSALEDGGYTELRANYHWSSESKDNYSAWTVGLHDGIARNSSKVGINHCVRAVAVF